MKNTSGLLALAIVLFFAVAVFAADRVVVVPLGKKLTGDATAEHVLEGKTFSNNNGVGLVGTMPDKGAVTMTPGAAQQTISHGFHNGSGIIEGDADLKAENIKYGINIFDIAGTSECVSYNTMNELMTNCLLYCAGTDPDTRSGCQLGCLTFGTNITQHPTRDLICD